MAEVYKLSKMVIVNLTKKQYDYLKKNNLLEKDKFYAYENSYTDSGLPVVNDDDEGKVLTVKGGKWSAENLPVYDGSYVVTPSAEAQSLSTAGLTMTDDITVEQIPFSEVTNPQGGKTVSIG